MSEGVKRINYQKYEYVKDTPDDIDDDGESSVVAGDDGAADLGNVNGWEVWAGLDGGDGAGECVDGVGELFGGWAAVLAVVFDAKVFIWSTRIVGSSEDEGTKCLLPLRTTLTDDGRDGRCGEKAVLTNNDALDAIGNGHLDDDLCSLGIVIAPITTNEESSTITGIGTILGQSIEARLDEVVKVETIHESASLFAKTRGARLLIIKWCRR